MNKLRVWWIPQLGITETFYIPVESVEEGKRCLDILKAYDAFQFLNIIKPEYYNAGGLQLFDEEDGEWCDWYINTENSFYENVNEYCESDECIHRDELVKFEKELFSQINWSEIPE